MKRKVNHYSDELKHSAVQEYLFTNKSRREIMEKYGIKGHCCLDNWIRKFGVSKPTNEELKSFEIMAKEKAQSPQEKALETRVKELEKQLEYEKLRVIALNRLIDIAENDMKIPIRKKSGAKQ